MSSIFLATHPRSMSTALERSFMTREDIVCAHEPFGDPFYFGPERLSDRYPEKKRVQSPYAGTTYADVYDELRSMAYEAEKENKRVFIKDMISYLMPEDATGNESNVAVAKSFGSDVRNSTPSDTSITVLPSDILNSFQYVFLIRAPHLAVPSYYKRCIPPDSEKTGFDHYRPQEAGYRQLRILYDHLVKLGKRPLVVDATDIIADPEQVLKQMCESVDLPFDQSMLSWDENSPKVVKAFEKWNGWHDDCLKSTGFNNKSRTNGATNGHTNGSTNGSTNGHANGHAKEVSNGHANGHASNDDFVVDFADWEKQWAAKFDQDGVDTIRATVNEYLDDYLHLRKHKLTLV
ncbi:hypothetical protein AWJ20_1419 [Sugiyamaella lignohabitans]|uniref:P-loop containing nucleoside triphosphate hydrolase protein n=1 Tax=Sugiyamaella lignohabitans TaxID=796027 RepID=A0A167DPG7_9ASCO|nr:uncharacterized protein AWJ20_1419 [Sugiyamaella lignohabitans]ANB13138.1 hypothetical protein AWJ20_1419 [Sugiyamaella lignohabitans]